MLKMDTKITLSFDEEIIKRAKKFADAQNISLSRLTEFLYSRIVSGHYKNLEKLPVADWVTTVAEGEAEYKTKKRSRKALKNEFMKSRR
jgi:hypothetical protein